MYLCYISSIIQGCEFLIFFSIIFNKFNSLFYCANVYFSLIIGSIQGIIFIIKTIVRKKFIKTHIVDNKIIDKRLVFAPDFIF